MKSLLGLGFFLYVLTAQAQTFEKPKIIVEKIGNVTNYRVEGNLEPTQYLPCLGLEKIKNIYTPPDLYTGVKACVKQKDFERATDLFMLADAYSLYDARRVSDETAGQGRSVLIMQLVDGFTKEEKQRLSSTIDSELQDGNHKKACERMKQIGEPNYFPKGLRKQNSIKDHYAVN